MKNDTQLKLQAYLDNELSPGEARKVADLISADNYARELYAELKQTKEILKPENEPLARVQDSRDFYWSKIRRDIESAETAQAAEASAPLQGSKARWWFKLILPVAGAVGLFAILMSVVQPPTRTATASNTISPISTPMHEVEDLAPDVSSITFRSEAEGVTVVWVTSQQ
jgi:anti-sigma factor RsiW